LLNIALHLFQRSGHRTEPLHVYQRTLDGE
jgi:hypothetical protein